MKLLADDNIPAFSCKVTKRPRDMISGGYGSIHEEIPLNLFGHINVQVYAGG